MMRTRRPEPAPINGGEANYLGSTPPEAYLHPDRRMPTPARAGRVKAGRTSAATPAGGTPGLGLDTPEHDGIMDALGVGLRVCSPLDRDHSALCLVDLGICDLACPIL